jgi:hypothetical protein
VLIDDALSFHCLYPFLGALLLLLKKVCCAKRTGQNQERLPSLLKMAVEFLAKYVDIISGSKDIDMGRLS